MSRPVVSVVECEADRLPLIRPMWEGLYLHQAATGLLSSLAPDGFDRWATSLGATLGRFSCVFLATADGEPVGFLAGRVRAPTPPFGPDPVGFISEVYVSEPHRGAGVGRALVEAATTWFAAQGIGRLELQVLVGNAAARDSYKRLGWRDELVQMVYAIPPAGA